MEVNVKGIEKISCEYHSLQNQFCIEVDGQIGLWFDLDVIKDLAVKIIEELDDFDVLDGMTPNGKRLVLETVEGSEVAP